MTEQNHDPSSAIDHLDDVLAKIGELARKSAGGDYIYRGEPECFPRVSSGLYRKYSDIDADHIDVAVVQVAKRFVRQEINEDEFLARLHRIRGSLCLDRSHSNADIGQAYIIEVVQDEILKDARRFVGEKMHNDELMDRLQHYGHVTNLIDFTTDHYIALFFACDSKPEDNGRIVMLNKNRRYRRYMLRKPKFQEKRVIAQKSVFVYPPEGYINPDDIVVIPGYLKGSILEYLRKQRGVTEATVYSDLYGFISYRKLHESAYEEFYAGLICSSNKEHAKGIDHYIKSIKLNPNSSITYNNRGASYLHLGEYDLAIRDCSKAIELKPNDAIAYCNRGIAWLNVKNMGKARSDLFRAQDLGFDVGSVFFNHFGSVAAYQQKYNVQLPTDIAAVVTRRG